MPSKKLLLILFFVPSIVSFFKLFKITVSSSIYSCLPAAPIIPNPRSYTNLATAHVTHKLTRYATTHEEGNLTRKEYRLISNLISQRPPCNLLFFGFRPQFLGLAILNTKGTTAFLEDDEENLKIVTQQNKEVRVYKVKYCEKASEAYELLKHAREHFGCKLEATHLLQETGCKLRRIGLPKEVYERKWDVVVVDGPRGDGPEAPGRMAAIYTAAVIARVGNSTDVFVHDVHRMIEKWYSWEFLCHENLISSKEKLWHFRVEGKSRFTSFCPEAKFQIV